MHGFADVWLVEHAQEGFAARGGDPPTGVVGAAGVKHSGPDQRAWWRLNGGSLRRLVVSRPHLGARVSDAVRVAETTRNVNGKVIA